MIDLSDSISNKLSQVHFRTDFLLTCRQSLDVIVLKHSTRVPFRCTKATEELYAALLLIHQDSGWHQVLHVIKYLWLHVVHISYQSYKYLM